MTKGGFGPPSGEFSAMIIFSIFGLRAGNLCSSPVPVLLTSRCSCCYFLVAAFVSVRVRPHRPDATLHPTYWCSPGLDSSHDHVAPVGALHLGCSYVFLPLLNWACSSTNRSHRQTAMVRKLFLRSTSSRDLQPPALPGRRADGAIAISLVCVDLNCPCPVQLLRQ